MELTRTERRVLIRRTHKSKCGECRGKIYLEWVIRQLDKNLEHTRVEEECTGRPRELAVIADGRFIVSASGYKTIKIWNTQELSKSAQDTHVNCLGVQMETFRECVRRQYDKILVHTRAEEERTCAGHTRELL